VNVAERIETAAAFGRALTAEEEAAVRHAITVGISTVTASVGVRGKARWTHKLVLCLLHTLDAERAKESEHRYFYNWVGRKLAQMKDHKAPKTTSDMYGCLHVVVAAYNTLRTLVPERDTIYRHLRDLLARIHRDGVHHHEVVGLERAVKEAHTAIANWLSAQDRVAALEAELADVKVLHGEDVAENVKLRRCLSETQDALRAALYDLTRGTTAYVLVRNALADVEAITKLRRMRG
jgi:hypothetical protein